MVFGGLYTAIKCFDERKTSPEHKFLCNLILQVMKDWATQFGNDPMMKSIFNANNIFREMDEYVVPLYHLIKYLESDITGESISLLDVASGKGYMSLLLSSLSVKLNILQRIKSITMIDKNKNMNLNHLDHLKKEVHSQYAPIPIHFIQMDLHKNTFQQYVLNDLAFKPVIIAIHPCKRLSSRCVNLFNNLPIDALFLAPCCVPNPSKHAIKCGNQKVIPNYLHRCDSPYDAWVKFLAAAVETTNCCSKVVRIRERSLLVDGVKGEVWTKHVGNLCVVASRGIVRFGETKVAPERKDSNEVYNVVVATVASTVVLGNEGKTKINDV